MDVVAFTPVSNNPSRKSRLRGRNANPAPPGTKLEPISMGVNTNSIISNGNNSISNNNKTSASMAASAAFEPETATTDRRIFCEELLADGLVQSFVDFFYLTHRPDPKHTAAQANNHESVEIQVLPKEMRFIRENLTAAENARRQGDTATVYGAYSSMATHYHESGDPKTGVYFYQKCLEIAKLTGDNRGEMSANHDLGVIHFAMNDADSAAKYHERHLHLAGKEDNDAEQRLAGGELVKVYRSIAETHESNDEFDAAVQFYSKCLESSSVAHDRRSEGLANYRLGRCFVLLNDSARAVQYLEEYEELCMVLQDKEGEGAACAALASAYTALQNDDKALTYLKRCLDIAYATENMVAQGEACCALGVIYNKRKEFDTAVDFFERNFEIARVTAASGRANLSGGGASSSIGSSTIDHRMPGGSAMASSSSLSQSSRPTSPNSIRANVSSPNATAGSGTALLDVARCYVGMARGNAMLKKYVHVLNIDTKALLHWKTKRVLH